MRILALDAVEPGPISTEGPDVEKLNMVVLSDQWIAKHVATRVSDRVRYAHSIRRWFVFDGGRWLPDDVLAAERTVADALSALARELLDKVGTTRDRERIVRGLESRRTLIDVMGLLRADPTMRADMSALDRESDQVTPS